MELPHTRLYEIASAAGLQPRLFQEGGGRVLVTVHGARVLGVFLEETAENLLWVNRAGLHDPEHARRFVAAGEWNLGGDRCWLAPEIELYFRNPRQPSHKEWGVPAAIDPGQYSVSDEAPAGIVLETRGELTNPRTPAPCRFQLTRAISVCPSPVAAGGLGYAGYELSSELRILSPDQPHTCYGLWQIVQVPPGGTAFVPVRRTPELVDYFQTGVASHCRVGRSHIAFPVTGQSKHKLGLSAADVDGVLAYYRPGPGVSATLIVRQVTVFSGAVYADYPAHQPQRRDIAVQLYNDDGGFGGFGELEYHSPAATAAKLLRTSDVSCTWCFAGPAGRVRAVARQLLGDLEVG